MQLRKDVQSYPSLQSGINLVIKAGMFATGMTVNYEQLMADHEMATFVLLKKIIDTFIMI